MENTVESTNTTASSSEMTQPDTSDSETISDSQSTESSSVSSESTADTSKWMLQESRFFKAKYFKTSGDRINNSINDLNFNSGKEKQSTSTSKRRANGF